METAQPTLAEVAPLIITGAAFLVGVGLTRRGERWRDPFRWPTIALLFTASMAHVPVIPTHLEEAPYMGVLFIAFTVASFALAALLSARPTAVLYPVAGVLCAAAVAAYAATRLVAFPQLADDVGNWTEPLGLVSVSAEAAVVVLSVLARAQASRPRAQPDPSGHGPAAER